jgi:hypothetical protein
LAFIAIPLAVAHYAEGIYEPFRDCQSVAEYMHRLAEMPTALKAGVLLLAVLLAGEVLDPISGILRRWRQPKKDS